MTPTRIAAIEAARSRRCGRRTRRRGASGAQHVGSMTQSCSRRPSSTSALEFRLLCHMHAGLKRRASRAHGASSRHPRAQARALGQLAPVLGATNQRNGSDAAPAQPCWRARAAGPARGAARKARSVLQRRARFKPLLDCGAGGHGSDSGIQVRQQSREGCGDGASLRAM